jgi:hypothetical protein
MLKAEARSKIVETIEEENEAKGFPIVCCDQER